MDIGEKKMLDGSLPSQQMNKLQTLSIRKLFSHYLPPNGASIFTKISRCSHTAHSYAGVSFPWWPFLRRHLSFCHKSNIDSLSFCMWKKDSRQGSSNKYQKTFWALYVICKSRWYTPNSFFKTKIANLTFFTLVFPCKHFSSYNIWFTHIKVICVLRLGPSKKKQKTVERILTYEKTAEELEDETARYIKEQLKPKVPRREKRYL